MRHIPSGYEIRGYSTEQLVAYGKAEYARAVKDSADVCKDLASNGMYQWYRPRLDCATAIEQALNE